MPTVFAFEPEKFKEIEIPQGENALASLPLFSKTSLRIYEGSKIDFNVVDPDTNAILIRNSLILKEINPDYTKILLSLDGKSYEETTLFPGKQLQLNYTYKFMPFMLIKQTITHYEESKEKRNVVLYFNIPFLKTGKKDISEGPTAGSAILDTSVVKPKNNKIIDPALILMIAAIIILVTAIILIKVFKKSKHR